MIRNQAARTLTRFRSEKANPAEAGFALALTLIFVAILTPLGAFAVFQAITALQIQHQSRAALETFWVAESGLEHALADITLDPSFDRLLAGPDGIAGTADDSEFPFHQPPTGAFPQSPLHYEVHVEPSGTDAVEVFSQGFGRNRSTHTVAAYVIRSTTRPGQALIAGWHDVL